MKEEIEAAVAWWCDRLEEGSMSKSTVQNFSACLSKLLAKRFLGHWYESMPSKGSGFRSLSFDTNLDTVLVKAGKKCGLGAGELENAFTSARNHIMFINPGAVRVVNVTLLTALPDTIYSGNQDDSNVSLDN